MDIQALVDRGDVETLKRLLASGEVVLEHNTLLSKADYDRFRESQSASELSDVQQGVKKVLLKN